jgi:hypothetical protein
MSSQSVPNSTGRQGGAAEFFEGDFLTEIIKELRRHADEVMNGNRPAELGQSIDQQSESYGRPKIAKAS